MSDTPKTDERTYPADCLGKTPVVNAEWAKELERKNAALRVDKERLDWLSSEEGNEWASRYFDTILEIPPMNRQSIDAARKEEAE